MSPHIFVPAFGLVSLMAAVSNMVFGLAFWDGHATAVACALFGSAVVTHAWHTSSDGAGGRPMEVMSRLAYSLSSGVAVYFNLAWLMWGLGVPVALQFLVDGKTAQASWIGPSLLGYSVACYLVMRLTRWASTRQALQRTPPAQGAGFYESRLDSRLG